MPRRGASFSRKLFEPLGYQVVSEHHPLDERFPEWGESDYHTVLLRAHVRLQDLLTHLYVLIPVLDAEKHYWVGEDEVEKLLRKGEGWLASHPEREAIAARYLRYDRKLTRDALARLVDEDVPDPEALETAHLREELEIEAPLKPMGAANRCCPFGSARRGGEDCHRSGLWRGTALESPVVRSIVRANCGDGCLLAEPGVCA